MADEGNTAETQPQDSQSGAETAPELPPPQAPVPPTPEDRTDLLERARAFLSSPQVRHEDLISKRRFLVEKGLTEGEIEGLLHEVPAPPPLLPAKTYPQPPPSRLPYLLLNVFRVFSWIAGGSAALLLAYFRFIYPRIAQTYQARLSLRTHHKALLERLTHSLGDLKDTQRGTFAVLPQPEQFREPTKYKACRCLSQLADASKEETDIPPITLLRCAIQECAKGTQKATSAELFRLLEEKFPWIAQADASFEVRHALANTHEHAHIPARAPSPAPASAAPPLPTPPSSSTIWTYTAPTPSPPPPLLTSLSALSSALPPPTPTPSSTPAQPKFQHTFQALSDLTGYIAAQTYAAPTAVGRGLGLAVPLAPAEEEVRREIRALKGLVLNRRSFMPRVASATSVGAA
ncbi:hypothetical protein C2E23DRAFT_887106 [Lenzites betulinus]|nr:hypothetical protein C2E23DRAFT_887106 [Lenzites betulinus]